MRYSAVLALGGLLVASPALADDQTRCPNNVLDAKTLIADTKAGVDVTIVGTDAKRIAEIRQRAAHIVEIVRAGSADIPDLEGCQLVVKNAKVTAQDVESGTRMSIRAEKP